MERRAGILLHPTSLPGRFGQGDFGPGADLFLEWMERAGQRVWQILPLGPSGYDRSPYGCTSAFAGNRYLISPEQLESEGFLSPGELPAAPANEWRSGVGDAARWKDELLARCFRRFESDARADQRTAFESFRADPAIERWLPDWTLFSAIKETTSDLRWNQWEASLASRDPSALDAARRRLRDATAFEEFVQFLFFRQWGRVRKEAIRRGISILGDVPFYIDQESADVWAHRELFDLDASGNPTAVSGVPPDYFSESGQRWGSPLFRWDRMEESGFRWWIARLESNLRISDHVRLDHFRGFAAYWSIPASEKTAVHGRWVEGPGKSFLETVRAGIGSLPFVAEDLGMITPDVAELRDSFGLPGMKVLQFAFSSDDSGYLPHRHVPNCVVYTGTHDNDTTRGWFEHAGQEERRRACDYLGSDGREIHWDMIRAAHESVAETAVAPFQDLLGLGSEARLNTPGRAEGNWRWRAPADAFRDDLAARLRRLAELTGRVSP
jgi:4-alpha-glucanotransferase